MFTIDHVQIAIPAGGENAARAFFRLLGFDEVPKPQELAKRGGAWFCSGGVEIHAGVEDDFSAAKKAHPALRCKNYPELLALLRDNGITVTADPLPFRGRDHCYISDPFGNRIELIDGS